MRLDFMELSITKSPSHAPSSCSLEQPAYRPDSMGTAAIDSEMRRRFEEAERTSVGDTALGRPALRASEDLLRAHFSSEIGRSRTPLENPHVEPRISETQRERAVPAAVLLAIVLREREPMLLVTQRHRGISYPGHWVFPGGRSDPSDSSPVDTALREAEEEIGLDRACVDVIGRLGDYFSHSGFRIAPTVAFVRPPFELTPQPGEVEAIAEIPLSRVLDSSSYFLYQFPNNNERAHFALNTQTEDIMLTGVTASICIGLYSQLLKTHEFESNELRAIADPPR
jgi:8-oxo-dGTP pyrophosphatase MutT (NUDIX family)